MIWAKKTKFGLVKRDDLGPDKTEPWFGSLATQTWIVQTFRLITERGEDETRSKGQNLFNLIKSRPIYDSTTIKRRDMLPTVDDRT